MRRFVCARHGHVEPSQHSRIAGIITHKHRVTDQEIMVAMIRSHDLCTH